MVKFRKMRIYQILLLVLALTLTNCFTDEYDLSKGLNTDMTLGGDSLSIPLGKTDTISLGSMINSQDISILAKSDSGLYSLKLKDSIKKEIDAISPVSFSITPISIAPITTSFSEIKFPSFQFAPIAIGSPVPIPDLNIANKSITGINTNLDMGTKIQSGGSPARRFNKTNSSTPAFSKSVSATIEIKDSSTLNQTLNFGYPEQLKKINNILLTKSRVTLTFVKKAIPQCLTIQTDLITNFRIDFPSEFKLSSNIGTGSKIVQSSFIIENAALTPGEPFVASFVLESLDMSNVPQNKKLDYNKDIPYKVYYSCTGDVNPLLLNANDSLKVNLTLKASSEIDDMEIETNPFNVVVDGNTNNITQVVNDIPEDISEVKTLSFEDGAALNLNIADPGISPFNFSSGNCTITLPQLIEFKTFPGLDNTKNELTIPYNDLFTPRSIGITGIKLNKPIVNKQITILDALTYKIDGLTVGSVAPNTKFNSLLQMNNKNLNVNATIVGLNVKDATLLTKSISLPIPEQNTSIDINQLVSTDVKRVYTVTLKTPSTLTIKININNLPTSIDSIFFDNYTIKLPSCLKFKTGDVNSANEVILNRGFKISEGFTKTLTLEKFDFGTAGTDLTNGIFNLHESVSLKGNAHIKGANLKSSDIGSVQVKPSIEIGNMSIALIEGKITPVIDPISQSIKLDLPDFLKQVGTTLDIQNPVITFEIGNTMGIPIDLAMNLIPKSKGIAIPNASVSPVLHIAAATVLGETTWSKFRISKPTGFPDGYIYPDGFISVPVVNMPNLLKVIPDSIAIKVIATITGEKQRVDLYSGKNQLDIKYSVNVPLDFGQEFKIQFNDTISDLQSQLKDILKLSRDFEVVALIESKIPMNLAFTVKPYDSSNNELTGITINADSIKYTDKISDVKPINFGLKETIAGSLDKLDKFIFNISATKNPALQLIPLKSDQYIIIELKVRLPKGININQK